MPNDPRSIYIGVDHLVELFGLYDKKSETFQNAADVTAQVFESDKSTSIGNAVTLGYISGTDGNYNGSIPATVTDTLVENTVYFVKIVINSASIADVRWLQRTAKLRGSQ